MLLVSIGLQAQDINKFLKKNKNRAIRKTEMRVNRQNNSRIFLQNGIDIWKCREYYYVNQIK